MSVRKKIVIRISTHIKAGAGYCTINIKDNPKVYTVNTPLHTILSNEEAARLVFMQAMRQFFEGEIQGKDEQPDEIKS